jgi:hypothetical protein
MVKHDEDDTITKNITLNKNLSGKHNQVMRVTALDMFLKGQHQMVATT